MYLLMVIFIVARLTLIPASYREDLADRFVVYRHRISLVLIVLMAITWVLAELAVYTGRDLRYAAVILQIILALFVFFFYCLIPARRSKNNQHASIANTPEQKLPSPDKMEPRVFDSPHRFDYPTYQSPESVDSDLPPIFAAVSAPSFITSDEGEKTRSQPSDAVLPQDILANSIWQDEETGVSATNLSPTGLDIVPAPSVNTVDEADIVEDACRRESPSPPASPAPEPQSGPFDLPPLQHENHTGDEPAFIFERHLAMTSSPHQDEEDAVAGETDDFPSPVHRRNSGLPEYEALHPDGLFGADKLEKERQAVLALAQDRAKQLGHTTGLSETDDDAVFPPIYTEEDHNLEATQVRLSPSAKEAAEKETVIRLAREKFEGKTSSGPTATKLANAPFSRQSSSSVSIPPSRRTSEPSWQLIPTGAIDEEAQPDKRRGASSNVWTPRRSSLETTAQRPVTVREAVAREVKNVSIVQGPTEAAPSRSNDIELTPKRLPLPTQRSSAMARAMMTLDQYDPSPPKNRHEAVAPSRDVQIPREERDKALARSLQSLVEVGTTEPVLPTINESPSQAPQLFTVRTRVKTLDPGNPLFSPAEKPARPFSFVRRGSTSSFVPESNS